MDLSNFNLLDIESPIPTEYDDIWHGVGAPRGDIPPPPPPQEEAPAPPAEESPAPRPAAPSIQPVDTPEKPRIEPSQEEAYETKPTGEPTPRDEGGGAGGMAPAREGEEEEGEAEKTDKEKKILGMKPMYFYGLLALVAIGGYVAYKSGVFKGAKKKAA